MGRIDAICLSSAKGTPKTPRQHAVLIAGHGLDGDAHAGDWHRQISILPLERIEEFRAKGAAVTSGDFGENLILSGLDWDALRPGDRIRCGAAVLETTQFGKECHDRCRIHQTMGDCIMPRHGIFARVIEGGAIAVGDAAEMPTSHRAALLTVSDKASRGEREDLSGAAMRDMVEAAGLSVVRQDIVPDDLAAIAGKLVRYADIDGVRLVLTSGGTGLSPRDVTPEATLQAVDRLCPGIPEAMRLASLNKGFSRAMLSRAQAGVRGATLIVNLPGSPGAVRECLGAVLDALPHGLDVLAGETGDCARRDAGA